jgi:hypothetical protein
MLYEAVMVTPEQWHQQVHKELLLLDIQDYNAVQVEL